MDQSIHSKCIILYGCIIPDDIIVSIVKKFCGNKYVHAGYLLDNFYDDICVGIWIKDNNFELRKYKVCNIPYVEEYYLILSKTVLDLNKLGSVRLEIVDPSYEDINNFDQALKSFDLHLSKFFILT